MRRMSIGRIPCGLLIVFAAVVWAAPLRAQTPPPQATFKSGVDLIQLDVSVLDRNRQPVRDLTAADFTILQDGKPRPVASFKRIDVPPAATASASWIRDVAPDVTTNAPVEGRVVIIVVDDASFAQFELNTVCAKSGGTGCYVPITDIRAIEKTRQIVRTIIDELGPDDVASLIFTENNYTTQDFTRDRAKLRTAIDRAALFPGTPDNVPPVDELGHTRGSCYCGLCTAQSLALVAEMLRDLPGQRKTMFYVSAGVADTNGVEPTPGSFPESCKLRKLAANVEMLRQAQLANVTVHSLDPGGLQVGDIGNVNAPDRQMIGYLRSVSDETGGRAIVNNNAPEEQVRALLDEGSSYYLLGFEAAGKVDDGVVHRVKVTVNRPAVEVISRTGFSSPTVKELRARAEKRGAPGSLEEITSSVLPKTDLPLTASVAPFMAADGSTLAVIALGIQQPAGAEAVAPRPEQVAVTARAFSAQGREQHSVNGTLTLTLNPTSRGSYEYEALLTVPLEPGRYSLRLGARTSGGLSGSVYPSIEIPDFAKTPLALSGVVLVATPSRAAVQDRTIADLVHAVPTARREFEATDEATALVRLYQARARPPAAVELVISFTDAFDRRVGVETTTLGAEEFRDTGAADYRQPLPLVDLAPGEYVMRIAAKSGATAVERSVRFTVK